VKTRRSLAAAVLLLAFLGTGVTFYHVIWIPLYRSRETARFVESQEDPTLQVDVESEDSKGKRNWTIADQQAISRLRAGLRAAEVAPQADVPASDQKYRLRIKRADSRIDEYEVVLGPEGKMQDRLFVVRRSGGNSVYGTAYNTPELRSALQQILGPTTPK
jgi:hypothetical protein